jgi:hypothetical protein
MRAGPRIRFAGAHELPFMIRGMASGCMLLCLAGTAFGHVPYLENADFSAEAPFPVRNVAQSKAFYAHLEGAGDIDYYALEVDQATRVYMHVNIPWCREYEEFTVNYALVGPGLPPPEANLPFPVPAGQGVVVVRENFASPADRLVGFERFAGRMYFEGPVRQVRDRPRGTVWPDGYLAGADNHAAPAPWGRTPRQL